MLQCVAIRCDVLRCVAVCVLRQCFAESLHSAPCAGVLQHVAACCNVLQCVALCHCMLQCILVSFCLSVRLECWSLLQFDYAVLWRYHLLCPYFLPYAGVLQRGAACCGVWQCVAMCYCVLQCVTVSFSVSACPSVL